MIELNPRGLITPNYNIPATMTELENLFVKGPESPKRYQLFDCYKRYTESLATILAGDHFVQWVDGSFTTREPNPGDIDVVSFINFDSVERSAKELQSFKYPDSLLHGVDAYIVKVYPKDHRLFALYAGDRAYWMDKFSKTTRNKRGIVYPKGFLEITISGS
nr:hypothetical protein [uncultured Arsenicibacter sp.]